MPFRILSRATTEDTLGQSWLGDEWDENIRLCEFQTIRNVFFELLPKNGKILEAGCGLGRWVFYLREKGYAVIGVDASLQALSIVKSHDPDGFVKEGDVRKLSFDDNSLDAVISLGVMEHFEEGPDLLLRETKRVLKKNGLAFISIPPNTIVRKLCVNPILRFKYFVIKKLGKNLLLAEYRYTEKEFKTYLEKAGFLIKNTYTDELEPPKNIGLYVDFKRLQSKNKNWELNRWGRMINKILGAISPKLHRGGVLFVCQKM